MKYTIENISRPNSYGTITFDVKDENGTVIKLQISTSGELSQVFSQPRPNSTLKNYYNVHIKDLYYFFISNFEADE